jgi:hypothetical protein
MDRHNNGLRRIFDHHLHFAQRRADDGFPEFPDIGSGMESAPCARKYNRPRIGIVNCFFDAIPNSGTHLGGQRVDWRGINRDDSDAIIHHIFSDIVDLHWRCSLNFDGKITRRIPAPNVRIARYHPSRAPNLTRQPTGIGSLAAN